ncbi:MAG: hypothetical protein ACFFA7_11910 [Promethearchaeota archaeon]
MKENKVITNIDHLTPEWMTTIFKNKGYLSQGKVARIILNHSEVTLSSNIHFLKVKFSNDAQREPSIPYIVVKTPKRIFKNLGTHEVKFYSMIAETMNQGTIPTCYDAAVSEESGWSHIILEDLSKTHLGVCDYPPAKRYFEKAIDCLAEIHAFWRDHPKLKELSKHSYVLYNFKENSFNEEEIFKWFKNPCPFKKRTISQFLEFLGDKISDNRKEVVKSVFSLYPQVAYERIKKENITFINADAHLGNFFFPKDMASKKSRAILFDWQSWGIGVGCQDLAYMIGLFYYSDYRHLMEMDLIKRYHNELLKLDIKDYSWDDCWYDYKLFALLNLYRIILWWCVGKPPIEWLYSLENTLCTIEDLNCMELLVKKE